MQTEASMPTNVITYDDDKYRREDEIVYDDDYWRQVNEYRRKLDESQGFDIEGINQPPGVIGLWSYNCVGLNGMCVPNRPLVILYARVGLQRYNMENGTNFELHCVIKFNMFPRPVSSYYITLAARDTVTRRPMHTFQVQVDENQIGLLDMTCSLVRVKRETTNRPFTPFEHTPLMELPVWPSDDDAFNDIRRFSLVGRSELLSTSWIRMYLQLAVFAKYRFITETDLSKLKIVKVAVETSNFEDVNERLKANNAILYIAFKGLSTNDGIGDHVERKAIIKRYVHHLSRNWSLMGELREEEEELSSMRDQEFLKQLTRSRP